MISRLSAVDKTKSSLDSLTTARLSSTMIILVSFISNASPMATHTAENSAENILMIYLEK